MKFTTPPNKDYKEDIKILHNALLNKEPITFSKFCDGELAVILNQQIDNKEFNFNPSNPKDSHKRKKLIEAFMYDSSNYFVGITCVNVFGIDTHRRMKMICGLPEERLTWADIWVNSNYQFFVDNIIPTFSNYNVFLFCNRRGNIKNLPFTPYAVFPVSNNAWEHNWDYIDDVKFLLNHFYNNFKERVLCLFCCGPFGNILAYELSKYSPENTYLDIGSTLNPWLQSEEFKRDYYVGNNYFSNMVGAWDQ